MALCNCFKIQCGSPGILKTMSSSILSRIKSMSVLSVLALWYTSRSSCNNVFIKLPRSIMSLLNIETPAVFRWTFEHWARLAWYQGALIWRTEFFVKNLHWSLENGTFCFHFEQLPRRCVIPSCPDLSRIGFGWVGWAPIFNLTTFGIQQARSILSRIIAFDRVLQNVNPCRITISISTKYTLSWCLFHSFCSYCERRGTFKSIFSVSSCSLPVGSINKKDTVCLLLEFCPPSINRLSMIKWRLNANPMW